MKYSVVICSFNKLSYLRKVSERLKSLRPDNEIILSDDFSTDGTLEWANSSGIFSKICVQENPGNYRLNSVRNRGIHLASNDHVILIDADCFPEDSFFYGYDNAFEKYPNSPIVGITERYDQSGEKPISLDPRWSLHTCESVQETGWENFYGGNVAFPKKLWELEKFDEAYNGHWGFEDLDFSIRLSRRGIKIYLSFPSSVRHLEHKVSKSAKEALFVEFRNREMFEKRYGIRFTRENDENDRKRIIDIENKSKSLVGKKILICKNVKALRDGNRNPKDYPYWGKLINMLEGNCLSIIEGEIPIKELKEKILDCDFFISIDSFFQHYAWLIGKTGAVIFSVTDPLIFGHSTNFNILKDRKYLRKNQFLFMEGEKYNIEAFYDAEKVYDLISLKFQ